jgi:hypothetical protein
MLDDLDIFFNVSIFEARYFELVSHRLRANQNLPSPPRGKGEAEADTLSEPCEDERASGLSPITLRSSVQWNTMGEKV